MGDQKPDPMTEWRERCAAEYLAAVERGEHDEKCEHDVRGFLLCNCPKRRREAKGLTKVPTEDLYFPPPRCPACDQELWHDGDGWACEDCSLSWDSNGSGDSAAFTDDHGDDDKLAADAKAWREKHAEYVASQTKEKD